MSSPVLARRNSLDGVQEEPMQEMSLEVKNMRESSQKTAEAVTRCGCVVSQTVVGIAVTAKGNPIAAGLAVTGMKAGEEATVACAQNSIESGYCDPALQRTRAMQNSCVIL